MGDMEGPEVEFLQHALKSSTGQERPPANQMSECRRFIERSERRLEKIDAERAAHDQRQDILRIVNSRYGLRGVRVGEATQVLRANVVGCRG